MFPHKMQGVHQLDNQDCLLQALVGVPRKMLLACRSLPVKKFLPELGNIEVQKSLKQSSLCVPIFKSLVLFILKKRKKESVAYSNF